MDLAESIAAFLHLVFVFNLEFPEVITTLLDRYYKNRQKIGDIIGDLQFLRDFCKILKISQLPKN